MRAEAAVVVLVLVLAACRCHAAQTNSRLDSLAADVNPGGALGWWEKLKSVASDVRHRVSRHVSGITKRVVDFTSNWRSNYTPLSSDSKGQHHFDVNLGKRYVRMSYAAYCSTPKLENWSCKWCTDSVEVLGTFVYAPDDLLGFVVLDKANKEVIVSFRGTHNLKNWVVDLKSADTIPWPLDTASGARIGTGFWKALMHMKDNVETLIRDGRKKVPDATVTFTGHSLGGALAHDMAAAAVKTKKLKAKDVQVITYGQPRCGNRAYAAWWETQPWKNSIRVTNYKDIVPHLPPMALEFHHNPMEVWMNKGSTNWLSFKLCDGTGEDSTCSNSHVDLSVADHLMYMGLKEDCS